MMDPFYVFSPMYIYMPNTAGNRSLRFLMNAFGELIGLPVFFLPYTISLVLKGNPPAYSHFVLPPTSIHTHAHHVARKEVSSPMTSHVLWSHSNHHPQFQKPPFPAPFPTGLKKNLNLIVFSLLSHSLPRCSFHILSTLVWGVPVRLDYVQNLLPKIIYMDHWPRNDQHSPTRLPFSSKQTIFHAHFPSHHMTWIPICQHTWTKKESNTCIPILFNVPFFPQTMLCSPSFSDHIPSFYLNDFSLW